MQPRLNTLSINTQKQLSAYLFSGFMLIFLSFFIISDGLAQNAKTYNLPKGELGEVISQFGSEAGILLSFDPALTAGKISKGLIGKYSVKEGLTELLQDAGISWRFTSENAVVLKPLAIINSGRTSNSNGITELATATVNNTNTDDTGAILSLSMAEINMIQAGDLKDLLGPESAISVGGSIPINQKLYLRGIEETALLVTIDGARQNNKVFHHNASTLIDPSLLKSVRAYPGVSPADAGQGAIGGGISFETVDVADMLEADDNIGAFIKAGYDSNSSTKNIAGSFFTRQGGLELLGVINSVNGDEYKNGDGDTVNYTKAALFSGLGKVAYESNSGNRFELSYESVNDDSARPYRANFVGLTRGRPTPESRVYDLTRKNLVFTFENQSENGLWNPSVLIASSESDLITTEIPLSDPNIRITYNGITESTSGVLKNIFYTPFAEVSAGIDFYDDSTTFKYEGDPDISESIKNTGIFVQLRQSPIDQLALSYGLRYDQQDFTGSDDSQLDSSGISVNAFAEYDVNQYFTLTAGYADVWGGIVMAESFILNPTWDYSAGMKDVESSNYVFGILSQFKQFTIGLERYQTEIKDGRTPSYRSGPSLVGDFIVDGYDISLSYQWATSNISIKYSDIEGEKDGDSASSYNGNYFTSPLGQLFTLNAYSYFDQMRLTVGANIEVTLDNDSTETATTQKQEGYAVIDVYADYEAFNNLNLRLEINNLTDESYADRATYGQEFITVNPLLEPGRSFKMSARYAF